MHKSIWTPDLLSPEMKGDKNTLMCWCLLTLFNKHLGLYFAYFYIIRFKVKMIYTRLFLFVCFLFKYLLVLLTQASLPTGATEYLHLLVQRFFWGLQCLVQKKLLFSSRMGKVRLLPINLWCWVLLMNMQALKVLSFHEA